MKLTAPAPLGEQHDLSRFDCGKPSLNDWLRQRASRAEGRSARTYVVCAQENAVVGYYTFAAGGVRLDEIPKPMRRNMPPVVPVTILARLAVDVSQQGRGLGRSLLRDGLLRALNASRAIGSAAVLVHALDDEARAFYAGYGFVEFPEDSRTLFIAMQTIADGL